jgi:hypothetical protein
VRAVDREQLRRDLSDALSALQKDQTVLGLDAGGVAHDSRADLRVPRAADAKRSAGNPAAVQRAHLERGASVGEARGRQAVEARCSRRVPETLSLPPLQVRAAPASHPSPSSVPKPGVFDTRPCSSCAWGATHRPALPSHYLGLVVRRFLPPLDRARAPEVGSAV